MRYRTRYSLIQNMEKNLKPPYTYPQLVAQALEEYGCMTACEVREWLCEKYPYFCRMSREKLRKNIHSALWQTKFFKKLNPGVRGGAWEFNPKYLKKLGNCKRMVHRSDGGTDGNEILFVNVTENEKHGSVIRDEDDNYFPINIEDMSASPTSETSFIPGSNRTKMKLDPENEDHADGTDSSHQTNTPGWLRTVKETLTSLGASEHSPAVQIFITGNNMYFNK